MIPGNLTISKTATAELIRQSAFGGTPGEMHIDLLPDGVTVFAPSEQISLLLGLKLDYYGDLSGGGFLISTPKGAEASPCGSGFKMECN